MRTIIALALGIFFAGSIQPAFAQSPVHLWSLRAGSTGPDRGQAVAVDAAGNVYVTGHFEGTVNFGGSNLVSAGASDVFLVKYNAAGVHQWSQAFGGLDIDEAEAIAVDGSGNVVVTGYFEDTTDFGGGNLVAAGGFDIFLAKYNTSGAHQWSQRFGSAVDDQGFGVAVDGSGNVLITGFFSNSVSFGGLPILTSAGGLDIYLVKFNSAGTHQWSQRFGSVSTDIGYGVTADGSGNVFMTGQFAGSVSFGGATLAASGIDGYIAAYKSAGTHHWSQSFGSTGSDFGIALDVDDAGNLAATGQFAGTVDFGGGNLVSAGASDGYIALYSTSGVHQWSRRFGSTATDAGRAVVLDASVNLVVTGGFIHTVNFGGANIVSTGSSDMFVAKYDVAGTHQWSRGSGSASGEEGRGVAVDAAGNALVTGYFQTTVSFGGSPLVSAGNTDVFVARYGALPEQPGITSIVDLGNDQGRTVNLRFTRSGHDLAESSTPVVSYEVYRKDNAPPSLPAAAGAPASRSRRELLDLGWTFVGDLPAHGQPSYAIDVPTVGDSTIALGSYWSTFFVRGATAATLVYFDSPADSGYSLDNLAPGVPLNLVYAGGDLAWDESAAADFDYFTVYGANADDFGAATVVDYTTAAGMDVTASPYAFYFVTATDFSGNEGKPAKVNTLSGVGGTPRSHVLSLSAYPNPFNPETTVRYTVPARGRVTVAIFDARGARVATLVDNQDRAAGAYTIDWDGRAGDGAPVSSGVYFARMTSPAGTRSYKMTLLK